jgi:hypothetical protein
MAKKQNKVQPVEEVRIGSIKGQNLEERTRQRAAVQRHLPAALPQVAEHRQLRPPVQDIGLSLRQNQAFSRCQFYPSIS